jgi:hypothetical protein
MARKSDTKSKETKSKAAKTSAKTGRKLNVYQAQIGFYDMVVAAPNQKAALDAWGVHQNLFADGQAHAADDPQAIEAARAHAGTPLMRPVGSDAPFALRPASLPDLPDAPKPRRAKKPVAKTASASRTKPSKTKPASRQKAKAPPKSPPPPPPPPPPDRSALDAAEAALRRLEENRKREEAELRRVQETLDAQRKSALSSYLREQRGATEAVKRARRAWRRSGGED